MRPLLRTGTALAAAVGTDLALRPDWARSVQVLSDPQSALDRWGTDAALAVVVRLLAFAASCWLTVGLLAAVVTAAPGIAAVARVRGDLVARRLLPAGLHRLLVGAAVAGAIGLGPAGAGAAFAAPPASHPGRPVVAASVTAGPSRPPLPAPAPPTSPRSRTVPTPTVPTPTVPAPTIPTPTPPVVPTPSSSPALPPPVPPTSTPPSGNDRLTVRAGDCLWLIAARRLGPGAGDADVAAATAELYAANRSVIGTDPDLIRPGQVLTVPATLENGDPA